MRLRSEGHAIDFAAAQRFASHQPERILLLLRAGEREEVLADAVARFIVGEVVGEIGDDVPVDIDILVFIVRVVVVDERALVLVLAGEARELLFKTLGARG